MKTIIIFSYLSPHGVSFEKCPQVIESHLVLVTIQ